MPTQPRFTSIDEYIKFFPAETGTILETLRQLIKEVAPDAQEKISYNMPSFTVKGNNLIYFAGWKKHISLYPYTDAMEAVFKHENEYTISGKGTIQIPLDKPLPGPAIREIVKFRLKEVLG